MRTLRFLHVFRRDARYAPITFSLLVFLMTTMCLIGCGKHRALAPVTGKVSYQGKPLRFGTVVFQPESGQYAPGAIQPDGTFQMVTRGEGEGVPVGKNAVRFVCFEGQNPDLQTDPSKANAMNGEGGVMGRSLIPQKYLSFKTSGITVDVSPGANEPFVFNLVDN